MKIETKLEAETLAATAPRGMSIVDALKHVYFSQKVHEESHKDKPHAQCIFCKESP